MHVPAHRRWNSFWFSGFVIYTDSRVCLSPRILAYLGFFTNTDKLEHGCSSDPFHMQKSTAQKIAPQPFYSGLFSWGLVLGKNSLTAVQNTIFHLSGISKSKTCCNHFYFVLLGHHLGLRGSPGFGLMLFAVVKPRVNFGIGAFP